MPPKLPRATLEQKIQILDFYHSSNRPQSETVDRYKNEISISTSSFSEWLKNEVELRERLAQASSTFTKNSRRKVKFKYEKINQAMDILVKQRMEKNEPINEPILREYWSIYAHQYGVDDPKRLVGFSHGWLSQFKKRHGLNKKRMSGHSPNSTTSGANMGSMSPKSPVSSSKKFNLPTLSNPIGASNPNTTANEMSPNANVMDGNLSYNRDDVYNGNYAANANKTHSENEDSNETQNSDFTSASNNSSNSSSTSNTSADSYDIINQQSGNNHASNTASSTGNQFRPQQGLNFNGNSNLNFSNFPMYNSKTNPQRKQQPRSLQKAQLHASQSQLQASQAQPSQPQQLQQVQSLNVAQAQKITQPQQLQSQSQVQQPQSQLQPSVQQLQHQPQANDYQQQLRVLYEKQKQQLEQQQRRGNNINNVRKSMGTPPLVANNNSNIFQPLDLITANTDPTQGISASDIERFIYMFADGFFHQHQYEYPQTVKIFQEFKTSFLNERIIFTRSQQQAQQLQQVQPGQVQQTQQTQQLQQPQQLSQVQQPQQLTQTRQQQPQQVLQQQILQSGVPQPISSIDEYFLTVSNNPDSMNGNNLVLRQYSNGKHSNPLDPMNKKILRQSRQEISKLSNPIQNSRWKNRP